MIFPALAALKWEDKFNIQSISPSNIASYAHSDLLCKRSPAGENDISYNTTHKRQ